MRPEILTLRIKLIPLRLSQLQLCLKELSLLETELGIPIPPGFVTGRVRRAIGMKIGKMQEADVSQHAWITYWLIVVRANAVGAGMLGFKGYPNEEGSTEIGYGIDRAYQNKGYMTEAVQALIGWAFAHPFCKTITATEVTNPASQRLLEKLGAQVVESNQDFTSWKIVRPSSSV